MKICKANLIRNLGDHNPALLNREFMAAGDQIKQEVAWQIFEEVNQFNDTSRFIDLSCLESKDAMMIAKQKIIDLAFKA